MGTVENFLETKQGLIAQLAQVDSCTRRNFVPVWLVLLSLLSSLSVP